MKGCGIIVGLITVLTNKRHKAVNSGQIMLEGATVTQNTKFNGEHRWDVTDSVATQSPTRLIPTRWTMPPTVKRREIHCSSASRRGALQNVMRSNLFFVSTKSILLYSASKVVLQQQRTKSNIILILVIVNLHVVFWFLPSGGDRLADDPATMPTQTESTAYI